jgi:LPS sulfotransferase NodH
MLCSALWASNLAGRPVEFLHRAALTEANIPEADLDRIQKYLAEMEVTHTGPNGVFGMKLHFNQFESLFTNGANARKAGMEFLQGFDKFIFVYRQDKILQAISELLAEENGLWGTDDKRSASRFGRTLLESDLVRITQIMSRQVREEYGWRALLAAQKGSFHTVQYEDLESAPQREFERMVAYLDITGMSAVRAFTVKLTDQTAVQKMKQDYLRLIGAFQGPAGSPSWFSRLATIVRR